MPDKPQQKHRTNRLQEPAQASHLLRRGTHTVSAFAASQRVGAFTFFFILAGIAVFIGGFAFGHWVTNSDPAFLRILAKSERYKLRYDAAKQQVPRVEVM